MRLVVRPDALIRFWCIGGLRAGPAYAAASGSAVFEDATLSSHVFLSDGSTHVRIDEIDDLFERFTEAAEEDHEVPQRLAKHFVSQGEQWVAQCESRLSDRAALEALDEAALASQLEEFCTAYSGFAPALYLPFPVERLYSQKFPALLRRIASGLREDLESSLREAGGRVARSFERGLVRVAELEAVEKVIQPIVESAPLRTNAEMKDQALADLVREMRAEMDGGPVPASPEGLAEASPSLATQLAELEAKFGWIGQWGYPPRYLANTKADLWKEAVVRCERGSGAREDRKTNDRDELEEILEAAKATPEERMMISDFAYYNYYRTYRMELLIRAQYLSVPLFEEIGVRIGLKPHGWTNLTPVELQDCLTGGASRSTLEELAARREGGWVLQTDGLHATRHLADETSYQAEFDAYTSVLRAGENARGSADGTDPAVVGGKAAALTKLVAGGYRVPDYVVLTTRGTRILSDPGSGSREEVVRALQRAVEGIQGEGDLAVRSSASVEDGATHSWAGRFESVLNVTPAQIDAAIDTVIASATSERALDYAGRVG